MTTPTSDRERTDLLGAESDVSMLETVIMHTPDLSDVAKASAIARLDRVRLALTSARSRLGLAS